MTKKRILTSLLAAVLLTACPTATVAGNETTTVRQVTEAVSLTTDVDYIITSDTPFGDNGTVDIANTDHAVLILDAVKPSAAVKLLAAHVTIGGEKAINNSNCQVKLHNRGCIIMPYAVGYHPLTVYPEPDFGGEGVSNFGLGNTGGYMNTLTEAQLNNGIRSFRLKRGYMVTFSTLPRGRGYSRCFIAADKDLEVAQLPTVLDGRISSYRIFKWYDTSKSGLANDTRSEPNTLLNTTSCYSFGLGEDRGMDCECVPHHIYEDWPSSSACGSVTYSPHLKTNNEPRNSADDHPQTLDDILANWENLMATGMRLCSPSSWDGSDYVGNASGFLKNFFDSIDARGWRCDIIDLHCYWAEGTFSSIRNWVNAVHRPVWISEWVWGASWNNNGIFGIATGSRRNDPTESDLQQNKTTLSRILNNLNSWDYIERYFYWNSEANCSKIYRDGNLTPAGEFYAQMNTGVGYNGKYEFVPTTPRQYGPGNYQETIEGGKAVLKWRDQNGEYNQLMEVQRKEKGGQWTTLAVIEPKETAANYTYTDEAAPEGARYRIHLVDLDGNDRYTLDEFEAGEAVKTADGRTLYAGGNLFVNGDFRLGLTGWTSGTGQPVALPYFEAVSHGGANGGAQLIGFVSKGRDDAGSLKTPVDIEPEHDYLFRACTTSGGTYKCLELTDGNKTVDAVTLKNTSGWLQQSAVFNSGQYTKAQVAFRWLNGMQTSYLEIRPLFATRAEAISHGVTQARLQAEAAIRYNTQQPALNDELTALLGSITTTGQQALTDITQATDNLLTALRDKEAIDSLLKVADCVADLAYPGQAELKEAMQTALAATTATDIITARQRLQTALNDFFPMTAAATQPTAADFATTKNWETKTGTYKSGDQRTNTVGGKTCWNAWWSGVSASVGTGQTLGIRQQISGLEEGYYALECKATTQHGCLSDQKGFMTVGLTDELIPTPPLTTDYFDLTATMSNVWQTLTTQPTYVADGSSITIGFLSSKQGATDGAWCSSDGSGDKREGWWCATDFRLLFHPFHQHQAVPGAWQTICLPYACPKPAGVRLYRIAGLLTDQSQVCLEEVNGDMEAGTPYIFKADRASLSFCEYGTAAKSATPYAQQNNLRGFFKATSKAPVGSYVLSDDGWHRINTTEERTPIANYSALIYKLDGMTELASWAGPTLPLYGEASGISAVTATEAADSAVYTLGGQRTIHPKGVYIKSGKGKTRKAVRR